MLYATLLLIQRSGLIFESHGQYDEISWMVNVIIACREVKGSSNHLGYGGGLWHKSSNIESTQARERVVVPTNWCGVSFIQSCPSDTIDLNSVIV